MRSSVITHCTAAMLFCLVVLLLYATVQQTYRTAANDPQIALARDIINDMKYTAIYRYGLDSTVDPQRSLGTFMQLYNKNGQLLFSDGAVSGKAPRIPKGVLDNAKQYVENAVTWQPAKNVRLAAVAAYTGDANIPFVVIARSLQEVESREIRLTYLVLLFGITGIGIIAVHWLIQKWINKKI